MGFVKDLVKLAGEKSRIKRTADQENHLDPQSREKLESVRQRVKQGDRNAMYQLGCFYFNAQYVGYDPEQACHWWTEAANLGNVNAQYNLGILYHGDASSMYYDENLAGYWFHMAANNGDVEAERMLQHYKFGSIRKKWSRV